MSERNTPFAGSARTPVIAGGVALALLLLTGGVVTVASNVLPAGNDQPGPVAALELPAPSPKVTKMAAPLPDIPQPSPTTVTAPPAPVSITKEGTQVVLTPPPVPSRPAGASTSSIPPRPVSKPGPQNQPVQPSGPQTAAPGISPRPAPSQAVPSAPPCPEGKTCVDPNATPIPTKPSCPANGMLDGLPCYDPDAPVPSPTGPPPTANPSLGPCESETTTPPPGCVPPTGIPTLPSGQPTYSPVPFPTPTGSPVVVACDDPTANCDPTNVDESVPPYQNPIGSSNPWDWALKVNACQAMSATAVSALTADVVTSSAPYAGKCDYVGKKTYTEGGDTAPFQASANFYGSGAKILNTDGVAVSGLGDKAVWYGQPGIGTLTVTSGKYAVEIGLTGLGSDAVRLDTAKRMAAVMVPWVVALNPAVPPAPTSSTPYPGLTATGNYVPAASVTAARPVSPASPQSPVAPAALVTVGLLTAAAAGAGAKSGLLAKAFNLR